MKRACLLILGVLFTSIGWSQTMNIHYKNGQTVEYNMDNIDYVEFTENKQNNAQVSNEKAVDLGLSVKWASYNVGATSPEQYGDKFAWGETSPKKSIDLPKNYTFYDSSTDSYMDIGMDIKGTQYDAAHVKWGGDWRMPTYNELKELKEKCSWDYTEYKGVYGFTVTGPNGNSLFFPANSSGSTLWASTIPKNAMGGKFSFANAIVYSSSVKLYSNHSRDRWVGGYIRPVLSK